MLGLDILTSGDTKRPRAWLSTVLLPVLVDRRYMENQGYRASFVRRFYKKHARVLLFDGTVARGVRGINELEFLRGLAEALGVRPFEEEWDPRDIGTTTAVAKQCLDALEVMEKNRQACAPVAAKPSGVVEMTAEARL